MQSTTYRQERLSDPELGSKSAKGLNLRILRELPNLRRYAWAITGSQKIGDDYIRGCLKALLQEGKLPIEGEVGAVQLFQLLHRFADTGSQSSDEHDGFADTMRSYRGNLGSTLVAIDRRVLLLVHQEGFSEGAAAEILDIDEIEFALRIAAARLSLTSQPKTSVLIIEDEPIIALDVAESVISLNHRVCGIVSRASQAIRLAKVARPGLILADIQLEDGSTGIAAVQEILKTAAVPIVFITGFPERLPTSDGGIALFVVVKPFDAMELKVVISQALSFARYD